MSGGFLLGGGGYQYKAPGGGTFTGGTLTSALLFTPDNTLDIGADGATRPRTIYAGTKILSGDGTIGAPSIGFDSDEDNGFYLEAANSVGIATAGTGRWKVNASGHLLAVTDASFDIGASGATRPRDLFLSRNIAAAGSLTVGSLLAVLQTRGTPNRVTLESVSGMFVGIQGNLAAATATTAADVVLGADAIRSAGWILRMDNAMASGDVGTRLWGLKYDARMFSGVPNSAPTDGDLQNNEISWYLNEATPAVLARIRKSDGTYLTLTITNGASPTLA